MRAATPAGCNAFGYDELPGHVRQVVFGCGNRAAETAQKISEIQTLTIELYSAEL